MNAASDVELKPTTHRGRGALGHRCLALRNVQQGDSAYEGLWQSQGGSVYQLSTGRDGLINLTCLHVHSSAFRGWEGCVAVKDVRLVRSMGSGLQAFRCMLTGALAQWVPVWLLFEPGVVTKHFPASVPANRLVYGYVERYRRISGSRRAHWGS